MAAPQDTSSIQSVETDGSSIPVSSAPPEPAAKAPEPTEPYSWRERHPNSQIVYIRGHQQANAALERLNSGPYGFDLEWKPNFVRGRAENRVALVQIANHEIILLLQVSGMQQFPSKLYEFLRDPNFIKVGVGIQGDAQKLYQDWNVDIKNCVDLALLARTVDNDKWKGRYTNPLGLARLIGVYENRVLAKGKITRSNWERFLTEPQQIYAANDAHAGYVLYTNLMAMLPGVSPQPESKCFTFDTTDGRLCIPFGKKTWQAANPNYDPGPPPPPREPKPRKPESQFVADREPGSLTSLPAPQFISSRGEYNPRGRGSRGNLSSRPPRQPRSLQLPSQSTSWHAHSHPPHMMMRQFDSPNVPPPSFSQQNSRYTGVPMNPPLPSFTPTQAFSSGVPMGPTLSPLNSQTFQDPDRRNTNPVHSQPSFPS